MTITTTEKDAASRTMTFVAEFDAPVDRVWAVWSDPRRLERWWGPPEWPAIITEFRFEVGGGMRYRMVGDETGERLDGHLTFLGIDEPREIVYQDVFIAEDGEGVPDNRTVVTFDAIERGTRMTIRSTFADDESFEGAVQFGAYEGFIACVSQIDALLTEEVVA